MLRAVASLGGGRGRTTPGDTLQGVTPDLKLIFFLCMNLERTLDKRRGNGSGEETTAERMSSLSEAKTKKGRQFFKKK